MRSTNLALETEATDHLGHEDLFICRYERLFARAMALAGRDREMAEDLVQDAFIHFTLGKPDLRGIQNIDGYLYALLRNLYLSRIRRVQHTLDVQLSMFDYDSAEIGLRVSDSSAQMQARAELRAICRYACQRKDSSKTGSALILRYFLGYYPSEIAAILRCPVRAVADWLLIARREGRLYLENPAGLAFLSGARSVEVQNASAADFVNELRQMIFQLRHQQCFTPEQLDEWYGSGADDARDARALGELVTCPRCLEAVNRRLGLPPLAERHPNDSVGPDRRSGDGPGGGGPGGSGRPEPDVRRLRQRVREVSEHRPQELHCAVNGFVLSALTVGAQRNEQTLRVNLNEPISFVEVRSEQGIRLLYLDVAPMPDGAPSQGASVNLSDCRTLDVHLSFDHAWPSLTVSYHDPDFAAIGGVAIEPAAPSAGPSAWRRFLEWRRPQQLLKWPAMATALSCLLIIGALLLSRWRVSPVSAAELLIRAEAAEAQATSDPELATHRTWRLEEHDAGGTLLSRRRVEVWQSRARQITTRRLYDESGKLIASEWRSANGERATSGGPASSAAGVGFDDVWLVEPAAHDFSALIGNPAAGSVDQDAVKYVIRYERTATAGVIRASLVVRRADMRVVAQTLVIRQGAVTREYRYEMENYEQRPLKSVAPSALSPEPFPSPSSNDTRTGLQQTPDAGTGGVATMELEIEIMRRLNQAGALSGEQVSLQKTLVGTLVVEGIVETPERKRELRQALSPYLNHPAVRIEVYTVVEAQQHRKSASRPGAAVPLSEQEVEIRQGAAPFETELRRSFAGRGWDEAQLQREVRLFANRLLAQSARAREKALALRKVAERFSPEELQKLALPARTQWREMISDLARSVQQETESLRRELEPLLPAESSTPTEIEIGLGGEGDQELAQFGKRLFDLARANDQAIRQSFSFSPDVPGPPPVRSVSFWRSLRNAERLAAEMSSPK